MIQLQGRIQCQKRQSPKADVVFITEVNYVCVLAHDVSDCSDNLNWPKKESYMLIYLTIKY